MFFPHCLHDIEFGSEEAEEEEEEAELLSAFSANLEGVSVASLGTV